MPNYTHTFLSNAFLRGIAFSKKVTAFDSAGICTMNINNPDDVLLAVHKAYVDLQPRTYVKIDSWWENPENVNKKGQRITSLENAWKSEKENVLKWLRDEVSSYMAAPSKTFDTWHDETCKDFLRKFNPVLNKYGYENIAYGKAQKIVNMTFKYLFCFDDAMSYNHIFDMCHMPIDSYILKWYENKVIHGKLRKGFTWSDMNDTDYKDIQTKIKDHIGSTPRPEGPNPFLSEFYIWDRYNP